MTKARDLANLLDGNGDVNTANLDNVPASNNASALTTGTLPNARLPDNIIDTGTAGTKLASGTTAQRVTTTGQIRFNTTTGLAEYYDGQSFKAIDSPPEITSISPSSLDEDNLGTNQTVVITGSNFSTNPIVKIIGNDGAEITPATTTRNSATQITITTPTSGMTASNEPYDIKITNSSGLAKILVNILSINDLATFGVASGTLGTLLHANRSASGLTTITGTDEESDAITFTKTAGTLPTGITLNSNGTWSGTANIISSDTTYNFTITATSGGQTATRTYSISVTAPIVYQILVVGGGGSGGYTTGGYNGGGGGSGGISYHNNFSIADSTNYTVTIGAGGSIATSMSEGGANVSDKGSNSVFSNMTAYGGGGGAGYQNAYTHGTAGGSSGGCEGGNHGGTHGQTATQGTGGTTHYGNANGAGNQNAGGNAGGGGGGTGEVGDTDGESFGGDGTADFSTWLIATSTGVDSGGTRYIAGGGGGGKSYNVTLGQGGLGGGGTGGNYQGSSGNPATANTGSGGGGRGRWNAGSGTGGAGGSGLVIVKYAGSQISGSSGGTIVTTGGYTYHTFTSSGTFRSST